MVGLAYFGNGYDGLDAVQCAVEGVLVDTENVHDTLVVHLRDGDGRVGGLLDVLDHLSARADNRTDHILRNDDLYDARYAGLVVLTRLGDALGDLAEDVHAAFAGLLQRGGQHLVGESVDLDIHLRGGDTVGGARHLEIHVAQVVLIAQNIRQHGPPAACGIRDQTHGDTRYGFLDLHAGVHQREGSGADRRHRRRAVRLEDVRYDAHGVGVLLAQRNHRFQGTPCQVSVADLAAAQAAGGLGLARREGREVVVEHELLGALHQHLVLDFFVELRAERHGRQRLRFTAGEDRRSVSRGQIAHLAPDRADFVGLAAVETLSQIEDHVAHGHLLHVVVEIFVDQRSLLCELLLRVACRELGLEGVELLLALVLHRAARGDGVSLVVELLDDRLAQLLVVDLVAVGAFHILAQLLRELDLYGAVLLDLLVRELDGAEHHLFRNLLHLALDHQDVVDRTGDHDVEVDLLHLRVVGVDDILSVDAGDADLRDGASERNVRNGQCCRGGQSGQRVGLNVLVSRNEGYRHVDFGVVVCGEQGAECAVDQTGNEDLAVVCAAFALHETSGIAADGGVLLLVLYLQGHEIGVGFCILGGHDGTEQHRVAHFDDDRAVGLFGQFARFDLDLASVGQGDRFTDCVVQLLFFHKKFKPMSVFELFFAMKMKATPRRELPSSLPRDYLRRFNVFTIAR